MPEQIELIDTTQRHFQSLSAPFQLDLIAYFKIIQEEVRRIYANAENMTEDQINKKFDELLGEEGLDA
jgi:hypothetical protein